MMQFKSISMKLQKTFLRAILSLPEKLRYLAVGFYRRGGLFKSCDFYMNAPLLISREISMTNLIKGDIISDSIARYGFFDWVKTWEFRESGKPGGKLLVDVGANVGYFSLIWLGSHPLNSCISVEASPRNMAIIEANIARNKLHKRMRLVKAAASNKKESVKFNIGPIEQTGWGGITTEKNNNTLEVEAVTLDDILNDRPVVDLLKIDVEGAELLVLQGAYNMIKNKKIRKIYFEENEMRTRLLGIQPGAAVKFLEDHGYECRDLSSDGSEWVAYPKNI